MYIGITAEWNPFHEGHQHLITVLRERFGPVPIITAMSGAFVQRGEPALFDKWHRARWAVMAGADAAVELPVLSAVSSADKFAEASVLLLSSLGCTHMAFGTESLTEESLAESAAWAASPDFSSRFHEALAAGVSYAAAWREAMAARDDSLSAELTQPNNMLGLQYAAAIRKHDLPLRLITIRRDMARPLSASAIRKEIREKKTVSHLPSFVQKDAEILLQKGAYTSEDRYFDACLLAARLTSESDLTRSGLFSEGLEHRWHAVMSRAASFEEGLLAVKSRRYLYSRLKRIGAALLLSRQGEASPFSAFQPPRYARLLALRPSKSTLLRASSLPVVTSAARGMRLLPDDAKRQLAMDIRAGNVQSLSFVSRNMRKGNEDYLHSPEILPD